MRSLERAARGEPTGARRKKKVNGVRENPRGKKKKHYLSTPSSRRQKRRVPGRRRRRPRSPPRSPPLPLFSLSPAPYTIQRSRSDKNKPPSLFTCFFSLYFLSFTHLETFLSKTRGPPLDLAPTTPSCFWNPKKRYTLSPFLFSSSLSTKGDSVPPIPTFCRVN